MSITLIDYPTLLATVNPDDLAMMTSFVVNVDVQAGTDTALADALFTQAQRLCNAGLLTNMHRIYSVDAQGNLNQSYTGQVVPAAAAYVAQLARERVTLSRAVLP